MTIPFVMFLIGMILFTAGGMCHIGSENDTIHVPSEIRESGQYGSGVVIFFLFVFLSVVLVAALTRI